MKRDYNNIPVEMVREFAKTSSMQRLMIAIDNIETQIQRYDYSAESLTRELTEKGYHQDTLRRLWRAKCTILEKRGHALNFKRIINEEIDMRLKRYEARLKAETA